jgi:hypothetical protein
MTSASPPWERRARVELALCAALAGGLAAVTSLLAASDSAMAPGALGVYFDGHLYLEIARSFPLPYGTGAVDYAGHAPGYPFATWLLRVLLPDAWVGWGGLLLLAAWIPAAISSVLFYAVCRELGAPALWPTLLFVLGNPRMLTLTGSAHAEPLAMALALAGLLAFLRGRLGWCVAWIALAGFTRFAAFTLLAPIALGVVLRRRGLRLREAALLAVPPLLFGIYVLYLHARMPGFVSLADSHRVFWATHFTWPFASLIKSFDPALWSTTHPSFQVTYATLVFYLGALAGGVWLSMRSARPEAWLLTGWVATVVGMHVCLAGVLGAWDFVRLAALAWPAALAILALGVGREFPRAAVAAIALTLAAGDLIFARAQVAEAVRYQQLTQAWFLPATIQDLDSNAPRWSDFRGR